MSFPGGDLLLFVALYHRHRHTLVGLCVSCTDTHSSGLPVGPPVLCLCPASGFSSLSTSEYTGLCTPLKAVPAPAQPLLWLPHYLLSPGYMLAEGLQDPEPLQASLVSRSQKSPLACWPLAISEWPGEDNGKTRAWVSRSAQTVKVERAEELSRESKSQSPAGLEKPSLTADRAGSSSWKTLLAQVCPLCTQHSTLSPRSLSPTLDWSLFPAEVWPSIQ